MKRDSLPREEVIKTIERNYPDSIPMFLSFWNYRNTSPEHCKAITDIFNEYPCDVAKYGLQMPGYDASPLPGHPEYVWVRGGARKSDSGAIDSQLLINDWSEFDESSANFPDPWIPELFVEAVRLKGNDNKGKYALSTFAYLFFERHWSFRGMENALMDYFLHPDEVHRLYRALCEFYKVIIARSRKELGSDGFFVTDDLGSQASLMFSPKVFRDFLKPYYKEIIDECHKNGMHFWLHSCGNITEIMDDLVVIGVDVIHPIQYGAMNCRSIAERYKGRICFYAGMEMQDILPHGTADEVRKSAREMVETFSSSEGGLIVGFGNGITEDIPPENIRAFTDEAWKLRYLTYKER